MGDIAKTVVAILIAAAIVAIVWVGYASMQDTNEFDERQRDQFGGQQIEKP